MKVTVCCLMAAILIFTALGMDTVQAQGNEGYSKCSYNSDGKTIPAEPTGYRVCKNGTWVWTSSPRVTYPYEAAQDAFVVIVLVLLVGGYFAMCGLSKPDGQPI